MSLSPIPNPTTSSAVPQSEAHGPQLLHLSHLINHIAHLLPAQGPITVFIHHNTLHAFEDLSFEEAVKKGGEIFGCNAYMTEEKFRACLARGRIRRTDLPIVLHEDLGTRAEESIAGLCTRLELRLAMLQYPLRYGPLEEISWFMAETDALKKVRPGASLATRSLLVSETKHWVLRDLRGRLGKPNSNLPPSIAPLFTAARTANMETWNEADWEAFTLTLLWNICCAGVAQSPVVETTPPPRSRHRDLLLRLTGEDSDLLVQDLLIRFCAAFVDQGFSHWRLPQRDAGFFGAFCQLYRSSGVLTPRWCRGLANELARLADEHVPPLQCLLESLQQLGLAESDWDAYLSETLLVLRGWSGMIRQLEERGDRVHYAIPEGSLAEFLAIRVLVERFAVQAIARSALNERGPLSELYAKLSAQCPAAKTSSVEQRAFDIFQLAQLFSWTPARLQRLSSAEWGELLAESAAFSEHERRRVFHLAFERKFYIQALDALALHTANPKPTPARPRFQALFCLDEREESMRRHLEEVAPDAVTYGMAGFFAVPMYYRGLADAHFAALCPVVIRPQHWVIEQVEDAQSVQHKWWTQTRRVLGLASHRVNTGSRAFALGAFLTGLLGVLASFPLLARIWLPRFTARLRQHAGSLLQQPHRTRLVLERRELSCGPAEGLLGFSLDEMMNIGERVLRDIGINGHYARLFLIFGHGSSSANNPHESAYDCGACGGARGGPNGRALAQILNNPQVRGGLARRGFALPPDTYFVGALHNTCNDTITYFDLERLPESHGGLFATIRQELEEVCQRNAHERSRRFMSAPLSLSPTAAKQHVEARSEDLAQVRPELGHATNALCIVGRRRRTRGLFLDRRAFLNSYDPTQDDSHGTILAGILRAVVPVCAGINLEYYFSFVDSAGYGCGSKLPHNITSLLGVMDGAGSDLRTGLPWQMVEIHEPVRLLLIIETTPKIIVSIMDRNPLLATYIRNNWVQLVLLAPESPTLQVYRKGAFHPYEPSTNEMAQAETSADWYRGWRDHLEFAAIGCSEVARSNVPDNRAR